MLLALLFATVQYTSLPSAARLRADIDRYGAREVTRRLDDRPQYEVYHKLLENVASGNRAWLEAGAKLRPGTDGGFLEDLDRAFMLALPKAPDDVLRHVANEYQREGICSGHGAPDDWRRQAEKALKAPAGDAARARERAKCLAILEK